MNYCEYKILKYRRPVQELFSHFRAERLPFLLESSLNVMGMGRYSFFGSSPFLTVSFKDGRCVIERLHESEVCQEHPLLILRRLLERYRLSNKRKPGYPFLCGAVGFFSYDFGFCLERIKRRGLATVGVPDMKFGFYDCVVCYDHKTKEVLVFSSGFPEKGPLRKRRAAVRLQEVLKKLEGRSLRQTQDPESAFLKEKDLVSNFSKARYLASIRKAKDYIAAGDIYQVNISQRFKAHLSIEDWLLYRRLVRKFPVSFSGFFKDEEYSIISASPERFLSFDGSLVSTRPMKGTRRRTTNKKLNRAFKKELIASKKEKAELLMIVDLERNDLGRVCDYGSIKVNHLRRIENYSNVFQATAEVSGTLHRNKDRLDLIKACFPGGSITGCPKIRAIEIIEELEPDARSIYTGSLGYFSFHNTLQFNILIRSFLKINDDIYFNVGGGIVTDSKPADEYEETLVKGRALMDTLLSR